MKDEEELSRKRRNPLDLHSGMQRLPKEIRNIMAGGIAGIVAKSVVAPLERIKILYQVTSVPFQLVKVPGMAWSIAEKEGIAGLWRGNTATMLRVFPYSGIQFMVFDRCKTFFLNEHSRRDRHRSGIVVRRNTAENIKSFGLTPGESLVAGMIAGAVSVICTYPMDLTRAQLALYRNHKHDKNIGFVGVLRHNYQKGGIKGLFRGLLPTLLGILPYSGIAFALNEQGKRKIQLMTKRDLTTIERMQCGALAGLFAQTVAYPLEVTRRRMQTIGIAPMQGKEATTSALGMTKGGEVQKAHNMFDTMRLLYMEQGIRGFFKGVAMNWIRGPIAFSISFTVFDTVQSVMETESERNLRLPHKLRNKSAQA